LSPHIEYTEQGDYNGAKCHHQTNHKDDQGNPTIITNPMIDAAKLSKAYFTASSILLMPNSMYCTIDIDAEKRTMSEDVAAAA
jgi:hypothetical protein